MFKAVILRGFKDTWILFRNHVVGSFVWLFVLFLCASVVRYLFFGWDATVQAWTLAGTAMVSVIIALLVALFWNVLCAPYKIERDRRLEYETKYGAISNTPLLSLKLDWMMSELLLHVDPFLFRQEEEGEPNPLREAEREVLDQASIGNLRVWGREYDESGMNDVMGITPALTQIPKERWAEFYLEHHAIFDGLQSHEAHVCSINSSSGPRYSDLRVSSAEAKKIWPDLTLDSQIFFEAEVSILGVHSILSRTINTIRSITYESALPQHEVVIYFSRPLPRRYTATAKTNGTVFLSVLDEKPSQCRLRIQGSDAREFLASIKISMFDQTWGI
tara:strand:- start:50 stop:1045 length:996 start_codon:yes stop_codon:yes gene_type:complete